MLSKNYLRLFLLFLFILASNFDLMGSTPIKKDSLQQKQLITMVESLQHGEQFTIEITSVGCFSGKRQTIQIINETGIITAKLNSSSKVLTTLDIEELIRFEHQLRNLQIGGCSTVDKYVLSNVNETFVTNDGTCSWQGYKQLLALFE
jgi:hypothetical protein